MGGSACPATSSGAGRGVAVAARGLAAPAFGVANAGRWRRHSRDVGVCGARGAGWGSGRARNQRLCEGIDRPSSALSGGCRATPGGSLRAPPNSRGQDAPARLTFGRCDEHPGSGEDLDDRLRRLGDATKLVVFEHLADLGGSVGPDDEEPSAPSQTRERSVLGDQAGWAATRWRIASSR